MTTVIIDGKRVEADPSQTILEAARRVGIRIPTLCHDPRLKPSGRAGYVVEVEGRTIWRLRVRRLYRRA
ncbi:MAG: (2Fe-2S)-binding protein [Planctomycetia bacterium]|nr:(2Fe-2S)-binding protein [Planctomycetia bacterium]